IDGPFIENMDDLPFFDFSDFDFNSYSIPSQLEIFVSKSCPGRCTFCIDWLTERNYRMMSGERIFRELLYQSKLYKEVNCFRFCDKTINGNIKELTKLCDLLYDGIKKGIFLDNGWSWSGDAMIRAEMTEDLLKKMHKARCVGLGYGVESGSDKILRDMGKKFSVALAEEVIKNTHLSGIKTSINIMVGFPTETRKDFQETLDFIKRNKEFIDEVRLTYAGCRVYSGSYIDKNKEQYGIAYSHTDYWSTKDNLNTYEERIRRTEEVCSLVLSLGLELRVNSRIKRKIDIND
ncbi:MAG: radical SAM protein, partial [Candidatus Omnitrophica bacterium]|nr:radical SAM protein [Candidatus Omnitrophota bacterium]